MKIYLLRHGETDWSKEGRLQGHTDIPMNENGIKQIEAVGDYFLQTRMKIDVVISGPLVRALRSAEIVAEKIGYSKDNIMIEQGFIERCFGSGEGLTQKERKIKFTERGCPNVESVEDLCERAGITIKKYVRQFFGETLLIAGHGSILKAVLTSVTDRRYSYNEGNVALGTGELCLLEYDGMNFNLTCSRINPLEEIASL